MDYSSTIRGGRDRERQRERDRVGERHGRERKRERERMREQNLFSMLFFGPFAFQIYYILDHNPHPLSALFQKIKYREKKSW